MQSLLQKMGKMATNAADLAANKAGEFIEVNKLKSQQNDIKSEMSAIKRQIGDYCYTLFEDGELQDEKLISFCGKIKELREEFDEIDEQIASAREAYQEKRDIDSEERL